MPFVALKNGRIYSHKIEYNLVDHCNFSCDECSHLSPFMASRKQDLEQFVEDLSRLAQVYRVRRFRFVGGEPLLHDKIVDFVDAVKQSGLAEIIEVASNGVLLDHAKDDLFRSVDSLSISWYPDPRFSKDVLVRAKSRCDEFGTRLRVARINKFRRMQVGQPLEDERLVSEIYRSCLIAHTWNCQTFYDGNFYLCSRPLYTQAYQRLLGSEVENLRHIDGVPLHEPNLKSRLLDALQKTTALTSCRYCLGTVGRYQTWRQLPLTERRKPQSPGALPNEDVATIRLRGILGWRAMEKLILNVWPSARLARALNVVLTAIAGH